jgi:hypothetical protein
LRVQLEQPGVLLLRRLGPGGPGAVTVAMFGHTGLGMLICMMPMSGY